MLVGANISMVLDKFSYQQFVKDRWGSVLRTINSIIIENMITVIYISKIYNNNSQYEYVLCNFNLVHAGLYMVGLHFDFF